MEETRKKLDSVKSFEEIENTVLLSPEVMSVLKQIASDVGQSRIKTDHCDNSEAENVLDFQRLAEDEVMDSRNFFAANNANF